MNQHESDKLNHLRLHGVSPSAIAQELGLSVNTVKSYIRRHPNIGNTVKCQWCEEPVLQSAGRKQKKFCSDRCRITYRNLVVAGCAHWERSGMPAPVSLRRSSSPHRAGARRGPRIPQGGSA